MFYLAVKDCGVWVLEGIYTSRQNAQNRGFLYLKKGHAIKIYGGKEKNSIQTFHGVQLFSN